MVGTCSYCYCTAASTIHDSFIDRCSFSVRLRRYNFGFRYSCDLQSYEVVWYHSVSFSLLRLLEFFKMFSNFENFKFCKGLVATTGRHDGEDYRKQDTNNCPAFIAPTIDLGFCNKNEVVIILIKQLRSCSIALCWIVGYYSLCWWFYGK
jgi:hypothetical protein